MVGILTTTPLLPANAATPTTAAATTSPKTQKSGPGVAQTGALATRAAAAASPTILAPDMKLLAETNDFIVAVYAPNGKADRVVVFPKDGNPVYVANNLTDPMQQGKEGLSVTVTTTADRKEGIDIKIELDNKTPHQTAKVMVKTWKLTDSQLTESQPKKVSLTLKETQAPLWFGSDNNSVASSRRTDGKIDRNYGSMDITVDASLDYPIVILGNSRDEDRVSVVPIDGRKVNKNLIVFFREREITLDKGKEPEENFINIKAPIAKVEINTTSTGNTTLISKATTNYAVIPNGTLDTQNEVTYSD